MKASAFFGNLEPLITEYLRFLSLILNLLLNCLSGSSGSYIEFDVSGRVINFELSDLTMETLFVVGQHRCQNHSPVKPHGTGRFVSSLSGDFRGLNCRNFQSTEGILPTPLKAYSTPLIPKRACSSPKTPSSCGNLLSDAKTRSRITVKSSPIPINSQFPKKARDFSEDISNEGFSFSELWAGPAYSNSPPPSSVPIPKFSVRSKRTFSLELPDSTLEIKLHPVAKSAPSSPTRNQSPFTRDINHSDDSATQTLRRILNLDIHDD